MRKFEGWGRLFKTADETGRASIARLFVFRCSIYLHLYRSSSRLGASSALGSIASVHHATATYYILHIASALLRLQQSVSYIWFGSLVSPFTSRNDLAIFIGSLQPRCLCAELYAACYHRYRNPADACLHKLRAGEDFLNKVLLITWFYSPAV